MGWNKIPSCDTYIPRDFAYLIVAWDAEFRKFSQFIGDILNNWTTKNFSYVAGS